MTLTASEIVMVSDNQAGQAMDLPRLVVWIGNLVT